jgi:hypothetical protein
LEDIASSSLCSGACTQSHDDTIKIAQTLLDYKPQLVQPEQSSPIRGNIADNLPDCIEAFDLFINEAVGNFRALSQELGGVIEN